MPQAILITMQEQDPKTGAQRLVASHGVDLDTGRAFVVPQDHPSTLGARWDSDLGEFVLGDAESSPFSGRWA